MRIFKYSVIDAFRVSLYLISISGLIFYVREIFIKYFIDPDIGLSEKLKQAQEVPFPSITICSPLVLKNNLTKLMEYYEHYTSTNGSIMHLSVSEQNFLAAKSQVCALVFHEMVDKGTKDRDERNFVKLLEEGAPSIDETFSRCSIKYSPVDCKSILNRVITDLGMCYTFNLQNFKTIFNGDDISSDFYSYKSNENVKNHWNLEDGYLSKEKNVIPYR